MSVKNHPFCLTRLAMAAMVGLAFLSLLLPTTAHAWWVRGGWGWRGGVVVAPPPVVVGAPVVYPPPVAYVSPPIIAPPYRYPAARWVPGHYNWRGYWVPGHWA